MTQEHIIDSLTALQYMISDEFTDNAGAYKEEIETAIKSLNKQVAKKLHFCNDGWKQWQCPICGAILAIDNKKCHAGTYCEHCGQLLDWTD